MPVLSPFSGLRPNPAVVGPLQDFVCPPYDVITERQRVALLERSPFNVVRIELPDGHYEEAARLLSWWRKQGVLVRDPSPALYGYRMTTPGVGSPGRQTVGVIGALVLEPPGRGILPHEQTTPKAKTDRLELIRATRANTSPIWCLCSQPGLTEALGPAPAGPGTVAGAIDDEGNTHEIWPLVDRSVHHAVAAITAAAPLLVADGHHRYETALAYQAEQAVDATGPGSILTLVVELSEDHLQVLAIHRLVAGLPAGAHVLDAFGADFEVTPTAKSGTPLLAEMSTAGAVGVLTPTGAFLARPRAGTPSAAYDLDSRRVDAALEALPPHRLSYEHDVDGAVAAVRDGSADAAVFCRPATVSQIAATAHGGARMPPKTTFFWPKPRTGMVLRDW
jgi:uncharacterized protein (DUF1015 family)